MANLKMNTDAVVRTAERIKSFNTQMHDGLSRTQAAVTKLDGAWEGSAATAAIAKFNELCSKFSDSRYNVLDNYVHFLLRQVGEGYEVTEGTNVSLADQFK